LEKLEWIKHIDIPRILSPSTQSKPDGIQDTIKDKNSTERINDETVRAQE